MISILSPDFPHILCLTEHHLRNSELDSTFRNHYNLSAKFCGKTLKNGGVCIFIHETLQFTTINLNEFCKEKDLEACAAELHFSPISFCILSIYRFPTGNFLYFLKALESILISQYSNTIKLIICGDININYLNGKRKQLDYLLYSFHLYSKIQFPTRIHNN